MIPQHLIITVSLIGVVFMITLYAFSNQSMQLLYFVVAFPPLVFIINSPSRLFLCSVVLFASYLTLPGLPWSMNAFYLSALLLTGLMTANRIITKDAPPLSREYRYVLAFCGVLLLTASIRGFGLRFLGTETWGGAPYIQITIAAFFLLMTRRIELTVTQWKFALYGLCLLSLLPSASQALFVLSHGVIYQQFYFIVFDTGALYTLRSMEHGDNITRLQIANVASQYIFLLAMLLLRNRHRLFVGVLIALSLVLIGLSGHRIALVYNALMALAFAMTDPHKKFVPRLFHPYTVGLVIVLLFLGLFAHHLPLTFQRALSWLPFANVTSEVSVDARGTAMWRFEVWKLMLKEIPKYLLIGKGFAFSSKEFFAASSRISSTIDSVMISRNYHNGILAMLLDLGIPGVFFGIGFVVVVIQRHWKLVNRAWANPTLKHFHRVFLASFVAQFVIYILLAAGPLTFITLFLWLAIMEGLVRTDDRQTQLAAPLPEPRLTRRFFGTEGLPDLQPALRARDTIG